MAIIIAVATPGGHNSFAEYILPAIITGIFAVLLAIMATYYQQKNRRRDEALVAQAKINETRIAEGNTKTEETRIAVESWKSLIESALAQVASVSTQLQTQQTQLHHCEEEVVPQLQADLDLCRKKLIAANRQIKSLGGRVSERRKK